MKKRMHRIYLLLAALCTVVSCTSQAGLPTEFKTATLLGMIYDAAGMPVANARVSVDGNEKAESDINGRVIIADIGRGEHIIEVNKDSYEPVSVIFPFMNKSQILYLRLYDSIQLLEEAKEHLENRNIEKCMEFIERSLALDPGYASASYLKAVVLYRQNRYAESLEILDILETRLPDTTGIRELRQRMNTSGAAE